MPAMPREPEAFAEEVAKVLRRTWPDFDLELVGPREMIVNGRRLDLENLHRMVKSEPERGAEIVEHYLDQLFGSDSGDLLDISFELARPRIMPRIQPDSIFEHLRRDMVAHVPFVNDTSIVFVLDMPRMTISLTTEQTIRWNTTNEELDAIARRNLRAYRPEIEMQLVESKEGGRAAIVSEQDGYDAARLLLAGLFDRLSPQLGGDFYVATPARDMFVAISAAPSAFVDRLQDRAAHDFRRLPYPISSRLFYVTRDGVAGTSQAA